MISTLRVQSHWFEWSERATQHAWYMLLLVLRLNNIIDFSSRIINAQWVASKSKTPVLYWYDQNAPTLFHCSFALFLLFYTPDKHNRAITTARRSAVVQFCCIFVLWTYCRQIIAFRLLITSNKVLQQDSSCKYPIVPFSPHSSTRFSRCPHVIHLHLLW